MLYASFMQSEEPPHVSKEAPHVRKEAPHVAKVPLFWRKVPPIPAQYLRRRAQLLNFGGKLSL